MNDADRTTRSYRVEYWIAVGCACALAALGVLSAQSEVIGVDRPLLGWIAVGTAVVGVLAAALPNVRQPPQSKVPPPAGEPEAPSPPPVTAPDPPLEP